MASPYHSHGRMDIGSQKTGEGDIINVVIDECNTANLFNTFTYNISSEGTAKETNAIQILKNEAKREFGNFRSCVKRLPFLQKDSSINDFYVDLTIEERSRNGKVVKNNTFNYNQIFLPTSPEEEVPKTILILGGAGFGKSTLATKIMHDWATMRDQSASRFELVISLNLREVPKEESIEDYILSYFSESLESQFGKEIQIKPILRPVNENLLIVLDGYDEISQVQKLSVITFLSKDSFFHSSTIIITSRPDDLEENFMNHFQRFISISALTEESRNSLVDNVFVGEPNKAKSVKEFLQNSTPSFLSQLSPLLLFSLCTIFCEEDIPENINTSADLIYAVARIMFIRADMRENGERTLSEDAISDILDELGSLFLEKLKKCDLHFKTSELGQIIGKRNDLVPKLGLFQLVSSRSEDIWEPIHKVFMDVLAVFNLNKTFLTSLTIRQAKEIIEKGLGGLADLNIFVLKREFCSVLAFHGPLREVVYVTLESCSVFNGTFHTLDDFKINYSGWVRPNMNQHASLLGVPYFEGMFLNISIALLPELYGFSTSGDILLEFLCTVAEMYLSPSPLDKIMFARNSSSSIVAAPIDKTRFNDGLRIKVRVLQGGILFSEYDKYILGPPSTLFEIEGDQADEITILYFTSWFFFKNHNKVIVIRRRSTVK